MNKTYDTPFAIVKRAETPPVIDGQLDDACWGDTPLIKDSHFYNNPSTPVERTEVLLLYDDDKLYVGIKCYEPQMDKIKTSVGKWGPFWRDDRIQVFLDTMNDPWNINFYNFLTNPSGRTYSCVRMGWLWNGIFEVKTSKAEDYWTAEMAIPYSSLNVTPKMTGVWRMDFCRERMPSPRQYITWGGSYGGFMDPSLLRPVAGFDVDFSPYCYSLIPYFLDTPLPGKNLLKAEIENQGTKQKDLIVKLTLISPDGELFSETKEIRVRRAQRRTVNLTYPIRIRGEHELFLQLLDPESMKVLCSSERYLLDVPKIMRSFLESPYYSATVYKSDPVEEARVKIYMSSKNSSALKGMVLRTQLEEAEDRKIFESKVMKNLKKGELTVSFPIAERPIGYYAISVRLIGRRGKIEADSDHPFQKVEASSVETIIDRNNNLLIGGKPFFPIGIFPYEEKQEVIDEIVKQGFNTAVGAGRRSSLDFWGSKGLKVIAHPSSESVEELKDHPALLAWYLVDEPEGAGYPVEELQERYEQIKHEDPYHPILLTNYMPDAFATYHTVTDILAPDPYPVHRIRNIPLTYVSDFADRAREAMGDRKPIWIIPQVFGGLDTDSGRWAEPTPEEERCMVYLAITHGAKGIVYFSYWPRAIATWAEIAKINAELKELSPVLLSPKPEPKLLVNPKGVVHTLAKIHVDKTYLIAVNSEKESVKAEFTLPEHSSPFEVRTPYEGRIIIARDRSFADTFPAYGVHIYEIAS